jgi:hypothetical protein
MLFILGSAVPGCDRVALAHVGPAFGVPVVVRSGEMIDVRRDVSPDNRVARAAHLGLSFRLELVGTRGRRRRCGCSWGRGCSRRCWRGRSAWCRGGRRGCRRGGFGRLGNLRRSGALSKVPPCHFGRRCITGGLFRRLTFSHVTEKTRCRFISRRPVTLYDRLDNDDGRVGGGRD